jgi:phage FluMu protein Com
MLGIIDEESYFTKHFSSSIILSQTIIFCTMEQLAQAKILTEYRCPDCNKLLCKGILQGEGNVLEVKCRGCGKICTFLGQDAQIVRHRSVLIKEGLIPDTDVE